MGTSGIQKGLVKDTRGNIKNYQNGVIVELKQYSASFTAYIDETCLGRNTANPKTTIEKVKWFLIREHVWHNFKALYPKLTHQEFFERLKQEYSEFTIIEGNNSVITSEMITKGSEDGELGVIYLLMPYSVYPEYEGVANIRTVIVGTPRILYCHFKFPKGGYIPLENSDKKAAYGQTVDIEIYTHLLPDWRNNAEKFDFEVELINKGEAVAKSKLIEIKNLSTFSYNGRSKIQFLIEPEWQKKHTDRKKNEEYYLKLKGKLGSTHIAKVSEKPYNIEYDSENAKVDWMRMDNGKWLYDTSRMLLVPYDTIADMMSRFEIEKTNMIQYIGDIRYTQKEYDPCGYSKITIKDEDDKERDALVIFDEEDTTNPIDRTAKVFSILAGDERKNISITLDKLKTKGVFCQGLLLESGQKHSEQKNVFQIDRVMPALRQESGVYVVVQDPTDKNDLDVVPDEKRGLSKDVSDVQQWQEGTDYKFDGENKMVIMPKYVFNKTFLEKTLNNNTIINELWRFNYFWLSEKLTQTYFLPISTCRYPNQVARIRVFPDVEWKFSLSVGSVLPDTYSYTNMPVGDINKNHNDKSQKSVRTRTQLNTTPSPVSFDLKIKSTINKSDSREIGAGYEGKIRSVLDTLITIKDTVDELCNTKKAKAGSIAGIFKTRTPITLKIDYPVIAITGGWKFAQDIEHDNKMNVQGSISLGLNPLIKGEGAIDILACLEVYPVAKAVIKAADLVLASVKGEMWFDLYAYGAVNLNGDIFLNKKDIADFQIDTVFGLGVRLGVKVGVTTKQLTFQGDTKQDVTLVGAELSGKGETSLKIKAKRGLDDKGVFIEAGVDFGGVLVFVTAKVRIWDLKGGIEDEVFTLVDPKPDILKKRVHIISDGKD